jgi:hypothetical protein
VLLSDRLQHFSTGLQTTATSTINIMKNITAFSLIGASLLAFSAAAFAGAKEYQVTGPVVDVNDKVITVMKGKDRWEIDRNSDTKVAGDVKVGDKVTVMYTMTATSIEAKASGKKDDKSAAGPSASPKK